MTTPSQASRSSLLPAARACGRQSLFMLLAALCVAPAFAQQAVDASARAQDNKDDDCDDAAADRKGAAAGSPASCDFAINTKGTGQASGRAPGTVGGAADCDNAINAKGTACTASKKGYDYYQAQGTLRFRSDPYAEDTVRRFAATLDPDGEGEMRAESGELFVTCVKGAPTEVRFVKKHIGNVKYEDKYSAPINVTVSKVSVRNAAGSPESDGIVLAPVRDLARLCR